MHRGSHGIQHCRQPACSVTPAARSCLCVAHMCSTPHTTMLCTDACMLLTATERLGSVVCVHNHCADTAGWRHLHSACMAPLHSTCTLQVRDDAATSSSVLTCLLAAASSLGSTAHIHDRQAGRSCRHWSSSSPHRHTHAAHSMPHVGHAPDPATCCKVLAGCVC